MGLVGEGGSERVVKGRGRGDACAANGVEEHDVDVQTLYKTGRSVGSTAVIGMKQAWNL